MKLYADTGDGPEWMTWDDFKTHLERENGSRCPECDGPAVSYLWYGASGKGEAHCARRRHTWKVSA